MPNSSVDAVKPHSEHVAGRVRNQITRDSTAAPLRHCDDLHEFRFTFGERPEVALAIPFSMPEVTQTYDPGTVQASVCVSIWTMVSHLIENQLIVAGRNLRFVHQRALQTREFRQGYLAILSGLGIDVIDGIVSKNQRRQLLDQLVHRSMSL